MSEVKVAMMP